MCVSCSGSISWCTDGRTYIKMSGLQEAYVCPHTNVIGLTNIWRHTEHFMSLEIIDLSCFLRLSAVTPEVTWKSTSSSTTMLLPLLELFVGALGSWRSDECVSVSNTWLLLRLVTWVRASVHLLMITFWEVCEFNSSIWSIIIVIYYHSNH